MSTTEVTNRVWEKVMGSLPSTDSTGDEGPVSAVSFNEAIKFCRAMSEMDLSNDAFPSTTKKEYRLPSESEWEYAASGGTDASGSTDGIDDTVSQTRPRLWSSENSEGKAGLVKQFQANGFGLFDMTGNVWEWTMDLWHENYEGAPADGSSWIDGGDKDYRVIRGGSWDFPEKTATHTMRLYEVPYGKRKDIGLRLVLPILNR